MRLRHHPKICGSILRPTRCVLGHRKCATKQEHGNGEPNGQSQKNYRSEGSLMDNRSHSVYQSCPGVQTWLFAVIIHSKRSVFSRQSYSEQGSPGIPTANLHRKLRDDSTLSYSRQVSSAGSTAPAAAIMDRIAYCDSYARAVAIVLPGQQIVLEATQTGCGSSTD
jgi:hypothetical protein